MKKIFNLFLIVLVLGMLCGCGREKKPRLIMVTNAEFPPYEYIHDQTIDGIDPEIVRIIAGKLGYELVIQNMNFDAVITAVQSGKGDIAASGITITEERKKQVNFTIPYVVARQVVLVRKNSTITSSKELKGKRIGVQHGTTGDLYVAKNIAEPERFSHASLAVTALLRNKIDAVVIDSEPAGVFLRQQEGLLRQLDEALTSEEYAFAINKQRKRLLGDFNTELKKMLDSGEVARIIGHYKYLHDNSNDAKEMVEKDGFFHRLKEAVYLNFIKDKRYMYLVKGFGVTIYVSVFAVLLGIVLGFLVALVRSCADQTGRLKLLNIFCKLYLTVIRGTPVVVQLLIIYFVIFGSVDINKVLVAIIAFGINSGAYVAEIIRSGIMAVDKGQMEAGRSLGLSYNQTMRSVIMPQAFKNVLPALGNEFIVLLKETSIAGYIALQDLTKAGDIIRSQTYDAFLPLLVVALVYLLVVMILSKLLRIWEVRLKKNE